LEVCPILTNLEAFLKQGVATQQASGWEQTTIRDLQFHLAWDAVPSGGDWAEAMRGTAYLDRAVHYSCTDYTTNLTMRNTRLTLQAAPSAMASTHFLSR
jgi:hypothetical protein